MGIHFINGNFDFPPFMKGANQVDGRIQVQVQQI
jgi:hypothetical protein